MRRLLKPALAVLAAAAIGWLAMLAMLAAGPSALVCYHQGGAWYFTCWRSNQ